MNLAIFCPNVNEDLVNYEDATKVDVWRKAMDGEICVIRRNQTWMLIILPKGVKVVEVKWIYKTKMNEMREIEKHKSKLI